MVKKISVHEQGAGRAQVEDLGTLWSKFWGGIFKKPNSSEKTPEEAPDEASQAQGDEAETPEPPPSTKKPGLLDKMLPPKDEE